MSSMAIAWICFGCMCAGAIVGGVMRRFVPAHHLSGDGKEIVKLGAGLIGTQVALVLGLLVSSAKSSFDSVNTGLQQGGAKFIQLDHVLSRFGQEAQPIRQQMHENLSGAIEQLWGKGPATAGGDGLKAIERSTGWQKVGDALRDLEPKTESQRLLKSQAMQLAGELVELRWTLLEQTRATLPTAFLVVLTFWFAILFGMCAMLTEPNTTLMVISIVCALALAGGVFLTLEMNRPFQGLLKVSSAPMDYALERVGND